MTSRELTECDPPRTASGPDTEVEFARAVLRDEADAVRRAAEVLGEEFVSAVDLVDRSIAGGGTVLVSGLGKSGLIGQKIASTMASLGIAAHAVHPTDAAHGDLGRFRSSDVVICLSHSGETEEVVALAATLKQDGLPVIAITRGGGSGGGRPSSLERVADVVLAECVDVEAARDGSGRAMVAPTSSTTVALALGDALALAVARRRAFTDEEFRRRHPGGHLGGLLRPVTDLLRFRVGDNLPLIEPAESVAQALEHAATVSRRPGAILIVEPGTGRLAGIFTDGDLRRLIRKDPGLLASPIGDVMTPTPRSLPDSALARDAVNLVREHRQDEIPVIDDNGRPVGLLDVQDLIAMRLVKD